MELTGLAEFDGTSKALGDGFLASGARKVLTERLQRLRESSGAYRVLALVRADREVVAHSLSGSSLNLAALELPEAVFDTTRTEASFRHGLQGPGGGVESVLAFPILKDGKREGVLIGVLDWSVFARDYLDAARVTTQGAVRLFSQDGDLLLSLDAAQPFQSRLADYGLEHLLAGTTVGASEHRYAQRQWLSSGVTAMQTGYRVVVSADREEIEQEARQGAWLSGVAGIIVLAVVGLAVSVIVNRVLKPARAAVNALREFSQGQGDLTRRLRVNSRDEIGELADYFNRFVATLEGLVGQVKHASHDVAGASTGLEQVVASSRSLVDRLKAETLQIASAVNELSSASSSVAQTAAEAAGCTSAAEERVATGNAVVQDTVRLIHELTEDVADSARNIDRLGEASRNIGAVVDVIKGIAEQTNLLALNAAIEAARAGEMGRGFAVVADEVRTLARRTQDSVEEIKRMIQVLQEESSVTQQTFQRSTQRASQTAEQSSRTLEALHGIIDAIEQINALNQQIAAAAHQQSAVTEDINRQVTAIHGMADGSAANAERLYADARSLQGASSMLESVVGNFRVGG